MWGHFTGLQTGSHLTVSTKAEKSSKKLSTWFLYSSPFITPQANLLHNKIDITRGKYVYEPGVPVTAQWPSVWPSVWPNVWPSGPVCGPGLRQRAAPSIARLWSSYTDYYGDCKCCAIRGLYWNEVRNQNWLMELIWSLIRHTATYLFGLIMRYKYQICNSTDFLFQPLRCRLQWEAETRRSSNQNVILYSKPSLNILY